MTVKLGLNKGPQCEGYDSLANEILYGGAAAGGKSHLLRVMGITWCYMVPGIQGYLFRREYNQLVLNHLQGPQSLLAMCNEWIQAKLVKWNWGRHELTFWNGSVLHLRHLQHESDVYGYLGPEIHFLLMDELTTFTAFQYRFLRSRLRAPGLHIPPECPWTFPRALSGTNPGNIGHNWVKETWVSKAAPYKIWKAGKSEGGMMRQYIPAKLYDNPYVYLDDPDYEDKLHGLGDPALVKAMLAGDWDIVAGGMFDDVWDLELNTCDPFEIPTRWPITRSFDWGSSKPFSVGWWTESNGEEVTLADGTKRTWPKGHRFRIAEWYGWNSRENGCFHTEGTEFDGDPNVGCKMLDDDIAKGILEREERWGWAGIVEGGAADSSIYDTDRGESIADEYESHGVYYERADKSPGSRKNGWALMRKMLKASHKKPQEDPGLTIFNTGVHFIRCIPVLPRDKVKTDDVDTNAEDHNGDEARYELSRVRGTATRVKITGA
jgi:hypothetical protein